MYSYASRLKLISEDFRAAIVELNSKGKAVIPENVIPHIFLNIRQIHTLSLQILSDLQKRMDNWKEIEEIGDVLSTLAPFLKVRTCCHVNHLFEWSTSVWRCFYHRFDSYIYVSICCFNYYKHFDVVRRILCCCHILVTIMISFVCVISAIDMAVVVIAQACVTMLTFHYSCTPYIPLALKMPSSY